MEVVCSNLAATARAVHHRYTGVTTAWNDNTRGVAFKQLQTLGSNNTDQRLVSKDGAIIPYVRPDNMDEYLGVVDPAQLVVTPEGETLETFLCHLGKRIAHSGLSLKKDPDDTANETNEDVAARVRPDVAVQRAVVRLQNAFVGVRDGVPRHVAPSNFSYQTVTADDPRNLLVVFTPTGWYVHVDGVGDTALLANEVTPDGTLRERWFEVSATDVAVGGPVESKEPAEATERARTPSAPPGHAAPPVEIGIRGSGPRTNRMLVVSIPLKQRPTSGLRSMDTDDWCDVAPVMYRSCAAPDHDEPLVAEGVARMANLALGEIVGERDVRKTTVRVDTDEPVVVTQIDYNTISLPHGGGMRATVGKSDVEAAIRDMERQYTLCDAACKLSQLHAMLHHWTQENRKRVAAAVAAAQARPPRDARARATRPVRAPGERAPALLSEARGDEGTRGRGDEGTRGRGDEGRRRRVCVRVRFDDGFSCKRRR